MSQLCDEVADVIHCLGEGSILREPAESILERARVMVRASGDAEEYTGPFPQFFCFLANRGTESIRRLEEDIHLVLDATAPEKRKRLSSFLTAGANEFNGGLFDVYVKATLLRDLGAANVRLDQPVGNGGRDYDGLVSLPSVTTAWEATVLSTSDEESGTTQRAIAAGADVWVSPGPFDPEGSRAGVRCYYTAVRMYLKVYEKLARDFDPKACQLPEEYPVVLAVWAEGAHSYIVREETERPFEVGVYWALDELFIDQPRGVPTPRDADLDILGSQAVCLDRWMKHQARQLVERGKLSWPEYAERFDELVAAPRKISAILLFSQEGLEDARLNYWANRRLSHGQMADIEHLFSDKRAY